MTRLLLTFLVIFFIGISSFATHIVGGEFEIVHIEDNTYLFRQIQYFDDIYGNPQAQDDSVSASIFRKSDDIYVRNVTMYLTEDEIIPYSNPSCTNNIIITKRLVYERVVELSPGDFDDPEGYYMVWERCCRNHNITNVMSPDITGQTFYIEFSPLMKNGERFINSTPTLFPPLRDYACINQFYYADFKGFDQDGDSLTYSLVTPLNSSEAGINPNPLPVPKPKPHPLINWNEGYDSILQVPGPEPLNITKDGLLRVTPAEEGLYVFSVKCEEFRDGEKIGEVIRDFQLFVVDCPPPGNKPQILAKAPGSNQFLPDIDNVTINYGEDTCFEIIVNDGDSSEFIRVRAVAVNFSDSLNNSLSINSGFITNPDDTLKFEFCLPQCINEGSYDPAIVDLLVYDNRCPQSLIDTLRISATVNQPDNAIPQFTQPGQKVQTLTLSEDGNYLFPITAVDSDGDSMSMQIVPLDFEPEEFGLELLEINSQPGQMDYQLSWDTSCELYSFIDKTHFEFMVIAEDYDECLKNSADTLYYSVDIELPPNNVPELFLNGSTNDTTFAIKIEELKSFIVQAIDANVDDSLIVYAVGNGFDLEDIGIQFENLVGKGEVQGNFNLQIPCGTVNINTVDSLEIWLIVEDFDKCKQPNADTISMKFKLLPPDNNPPIIRVNNLTSPDSIYFEVGQNISLPVTSTDPDGDMVSLELIDYSNFNEIYGIQFNTTSQGSTSFANFTWSATCDLLTEGYQAGIYPFTIRSEDNKCFVPDSSVLDFTIVIQDKFVNYDFLPPNAFTPNTEDNINEVFYIPDLPIDNCENTFEEIIIYNRWGQKVFESSQREFRWDGDNKSNGVYYYTLIYSNKTFKGIINLIK